MSNTTQEKIDVKTTPKKGRPSKLELLERKRKVMKEKFLEEHPQFNDNTANVSAPMIAVTPSNAGEVLATASQKVIALYEQLANSIKEDDFRKMTIKEKINALQKLSYIHNTQKKMKPPSLNFIKLNVKESTPQALEEALLDFNKEGDEEE